MVDAQETLSRIVNEWRKDKVLNYMALRSRGLCFYVCKANYKFISLFFKYIFLISEREMEREI